MLSLLKDKVTLTGVTIGTVVTAISSVFMFIFHKQLPLEVVTFLPVVVAFIGHYLGVTFATTRAALKELAEDQK
jgi:uncharacterized protein YacL